MKRSVTTGPFSIFFTNVNTKMKIPGHSHFAEVTFVWESLGDVGFPAFEKTYAEIRSKLKEMMSRPFRNCTNEDVADLLFNAFDTWELPEVITDYGGAFRLAEIRLSVRGVPDNIGHADGFTTYVVARE